MISSPPKQMTSSYVLKMIEPFALELLDDLGSDTDYVLVVTNKEGEILNIFGNEIAIENAKSRRLACGVNMFEKGAGNNAISKSIHNQRPYQITGNEHDSEELQHLTCSAAPIFDANDKVFGSICLTGPKEAIHPHTFGLVIATAKAIENRLHNTTVQQQLFEAQQYAFSIINHLSFGLVAFDGSGEVFWVNDTACRSLNTRRLHLINKTVAIVYPNWRDIKQQIDKGERILDLEAELNTKNSTEKYLLNAYAIMNQRDENIGYVITFRPLSRMLKLINQYAAPQLSFTFEKIIYKSKTMQALVDYAKTVASTPSSVLITGESGTGKEVFAQAIHNASDRRNQGFVAINCGAISSSLIESELFGYEEGAFTGAQKNGRAGKIEIADQGTLFLDEIGEMPLEMQVKLLRVLQEQTITRVGGVKEQKVDIRVIAATNKNLKEEVKAGNFRQDLYYRLNVIPMELLPLRERKMDIPILFHYFLTRKANKLDRPIPKIDNPTMKRIVAHSWPGNVRELENFAEKTVILDGQHIDIFFAEGEKNELDAPQNILDIDTCEQLPTLEDLEKEAIEKYMDIFNKNISKTARALGVGRNTLYQKLQRFGLS